MTDAENSLCEIDHRRNPGVDPRHSTCPDLDLVFHVVATEIQAERFARRSRLWAAKASRWRRRAVAHGTRAGWVEAIRQARACESISEHFKNKTEELLK